MSKSPAQTRAERGQTLRNIWTHITWFTTPAQREEWGVREDNRMDMNVMRVLVELARIGGNHE